MSNFSSNELVDIQNAEYAANEESENESLQDYYRVRGTSDATRFDSWLRDIYEQTQFKPVLLTSVFQELRERCFDEIGTVVNRFAKEAAELNERSNETAPKVASGT